MEQKSKWVKIFPPLLFFVLSMLSFNLYAMYLGNPHRPDTVWQPEHCDDGCVVQGHYLKFLSQPSCRDVTWVNGSYDDSGNYVSPHFRVHRYVVVNPGSESYYPGYPM